MQRFILPGACRRCSTWVITGHRCGCRSLIILIALEMERESILFLIVQEEVMGGLASGRDCCRKVMVSEEGGGHTGCVKSLALAVWTLLLMLLIFYDHYSLHPILSLTYHCLLLNHHTRAVLSGRSQTSTWTRYTARSNAVSVVHKRRKCNINTWLLFFEYKNVLTGGL